MAGAVGFGVAGLGGAAVGVVGSVAVVALLEALGAERDRNGPARLDPMVA